jgi:uncharacterized DUF497 family protein
MDSEHFAWDDAKAEANFRKHKVRFEHAVQACEDPFALIDLDDSEDYGEDRFILIGQARRWRAGGRLYGAQSAHSNHFGSRGQRS